LRKIRILAGIMRQTGADRILSAFGLFFIASAVIIWIWEPQIRTLGDALWFCCGVI